MRKLAFLLLLSLLLFPSCKKEGADEKVLNIAVSQEPSSLDVMKSSSRVSRSVMAGNVFERLLTQNKDGEPTGELCDAFEMGEDAKSWTFHLRKNVKFHNGDVMDSSDAVASLNRWVDCYSAVKNLVGDARFVSLDNSTIYIESENSLLLLPYMLSGSPYVAAIMPKETLETTDELGFLTEFIGTGPYVLSSWESGQNITLKKFEDYSAYGGEMDGLSGYKHAYIPTLVYYFVLDPVTRAAGLKSGQYMFNDDTVNDDHARLEGDENLIISSGEEDGSLVLIFNKREGLAKNLYIREAVNTALDLEAVMKARDINGKFVIHPSYMESQQKSWINLGNEAKHNLADKESARKILEANGYDGIPFRILVSNTSNLDRSAMVVKSELEKAGFTVNLTVADWATVMDWRGDSTAYDMFITVMSQVPLPSLKLFLDPNYPGWSDDGRLEALMTAFARSKTMEEAQDAWRVAEAYCYEYLPVIVAGHYLSGSAYRRELTGVEEQFGYYFYNSELE